MRWQAFNLIFLLLSSPAWADDFLDRLDFYYPRYDWNSAIEAVLEDPRRAAEAVPQFRTQAAQNQDFYRPNDLYFFADFIERVLHVHAGAPSPAKPRKWTGTPIEAEPAEVDIQKETALARRLWNHAAKAMELGDLSYADYLLRTAVHASHKIAWARQTVPPDLLDLQKHYRLYTMGMAQGGFTYTRNTDLMLATELRSKNPETTQLALMAFVMVDRVTKRSDRIDNNLDLLEKLSDRELSFPVLSFQFERLLHKKDLDWHEFAKLHERAWSRFSLKTSVSEDPVLAALQRRWTGEAAEFWLTELEYRSRESEGTQAALLIEQDLQLLAEAGFGHILVEHLLDRSDIARAGGDLALAASFTEKAEVELQRYSRSAEGPMKRFAAEETSLGYSRVRNFHPLDLKTRLLQAQLKNLLARGSEISDQDWDKVALLAAELLDLTDYGDNKYWSAVQFTDYTVLALQRKKELLANVPTILFETEYLVELDPDPIVKSELLISRARLLKATASPQEAAAAYSSAVESIERYLKNSEASLGKAQRVRKQAREAYRGLAELMLESGKNEEALELLAKLSQVETREVMQTALLRNASSDLSSTIHQAALLERQTTALNLRAAQAEHSQSVTKSEDLKVVGQLLADTKARYYQAVKELQQQEPNFNRLSVRPVNFAHIQSSLPQDTTVVQYFSTEKTLYIFVVSREDLKVRAVAVGSEELDGHILTALAGLADADSQSQAQNDWSHPMLRELRRSLAKLGQYLVEPIEQDLGGRPVLAVIPSGLLNYLPFSALITEENETRPRFLVEKYQTVSILKAVDLDGLLSPPPPRGGSLVGVGNPDGTLSAAQEEIESIGKLFKNSQILTTNQATVESLKKLCASKPNYLHLATHGSVNSREPLKSYLVMADGPLTLSDITGLDIGEPSLITLSACQTAMGEQQMDPGQDLTTLAEAFWFAGGHSLVASLWSVDDDSTGELMEVFYEGLKQNKSKSEALRAAQLSLFEKERTALPFHWAPFTLIGDWR